MVIYLLMEILIRPAAFFFPVTGDRVEPGEMDSVVQPDSWMYQTRL